MSWGGLAKIYAKCSQDGGPRKKEGFPPRKENWVARHIFPGGNNKNSYPVAGTHAPHTHTRGQKIIFLVLILGVGQGDGSERAPSATFAAAAPLPSTGTLARARVQGGKGGDKATGRKATLNQQNMEIG